MRVGPIVGPYHVGRSMRARALIARLALAVLGMAACHGGDAGPTGPGASLSPQAREYLEGVLSLMERQSLRRQEIDWDDFRTEVLAAADGARSTADTYPAIRVALELLGDGHSRFRTPDGTVLFVPTRSCVAPAVSAAPSLPATIGYVRIPAFSARGEAATAFAREIQQAIRAQDHDSVVGWVVDLRGNVGGSMWPMIVGVGPLLGDGAHGFFVEPGEASDGWLYDDGVVRFSDGATSVTTVDAPYHLRRTPPRVAVLLDGRVASAGEGVAIAFRSRPQTASFGTTTCGFATGVVGYPLADGATLGLTTSMMADIWKRTYPNGVQPDEVIADPDGVVRRAVEWLESGA